MNLTWSKIPEDTFSRDVAQIIYVIHVFLCEDNLVKSLILSSRDSNYYNVTEETKKHRKFHSQPAFDTGRKNVHNLREHIHVYYEHLGEQPTDLSKAR